MPPLAALSDFWFYTLIALGALFALFLIGVVLGLGMWVGNGIWQSRADRALNQQWQAWYEAQEKKPGAQPGKESQP